MLLRRYLHYPRPRPFSLPPLQWPREVSGCLSTCQQGCSCATGPRKLGPSMDSNRAAEAAGGFVLSNSLDGTKRNAAAPDDPPGSTAWQCQEGMAIMEYDRPWQLQVRTIGSLPSLLRQHDDGSQLGKLDVKVITYLALGRVAEIGPGCRCSSYFGHGHRPGAKWLNPQGQQGSLDSCLIRRCAHVASMFIDA